MEYDYTIITDAAKDFDHILDAGAGLYLKSIKTPGAPFIRPAFGLSLQPLRPNRVACLADMSCAANSSAKYTDFPVLVDRDFVDVMKAFFVSSFQKAKAAPQKLVNIGSRSADSLDDSPHVTRAMLSGMDPTIVALAWACAPQHDIFASTRRRWLRKTCFTAEGTAEMSQKVHQVMKEFLLSDLFLTLLPKAKSLWEYRQWLCCNIRNCGLLIDDPEGVDEAALPACRFEAQDDQLFFMAAHSHPMNYNAWHYRRLRFRTLHSNTSSTREGCDSACDAIRVDSEKVIQFTREHNSDGSATSYLLFLLQEQEDLDRKADVSLLEAELLAKGTGQADAKPLRSRLQEGPNASKDDGSGRCVSESFPSIRLAPALWRSFMAVTQAEIRLHSEKGHECMWHLRLGLVQWACTRSPHHRVLSLWSAEDELRWVSAYAGLHLLDSAHALLSPVTGLPHAWSESSGSPAWTSFNAARYGCQLAAILLDTSSRASPSVASDRKAFLLPSLGLP
ncbi:hypothetical protein LSCM1_05150 [Leishmania martiniquensis]|uniref:Uncharacterized protein n=1 Tax=Leishmania martiniquensis TaxID=1580590 RepID=A0A836KTP3_9TRYP|nr:hypothetical protein LSCM1_05150 [Leishmania martiniquensis]